jgi:hypothetical protein
MDAQGGGGDPQRKSLGTRSTNFAAEEIGRGRNIIDIGKEAIRIHLRLLVEVFET